MEAQSINENNNIEMAVENLKPKVFWKDKKVIIEQLKKWNTDKLNNAIAKSLETEISMKSSAARSDLLLKNLT